MKASYSELRGLLLGMAEERSTDSLLARVVNELCTHPDVALARIWTLAPGTDCGTCPMRRECPQQTTCLHLVASAGQPKTPGEDWSRLDGGFRRFPIGVRKIGRLGLGESICVEDIKGDIEGDGQNERGESWIVRPEWALAEDIHGFGGTPLVFQGEVLGALGVFTRSTFCPDTVDWLRLISDHIAVALANSRAFHEVESLRAQLALENEYLREEVRDVKAPDGIIGRSPALQSVLERIELVAPTEATVLIQGPSGAGKELVAREIHRQSGRAEGPLIQVNCSAIPSELYESEFFGHVRGSFTGATRDRAGRFAAAEGGTLFLDEIGEIPLSLQAKLLRVLQERTYERVGEERARSADVRVIAATNRDLRDEVDAGRFREDLYYRLDVFPITVPPLSDRRDDIVPLTEHFLARAAAETGQPPPRLTRAEAERLEAHDWPGNVRELQNTIERAFITWRGGPLRLEIGPTSKGQRRPTTKGGDDAAPLLNEEQMRDLERDNLRRALVQSRWKISGPGGAAELLGVKSTTLTSRVRKLGIERPLS